MLLMIVLDYRNYLKNFTFRERGIFLSHFSINYDYKQKEKKNGGHFVSIRDNVESALLEVEKKGNQVKMVIYRSEKTNKFTLPLELFERMYNDIIHDNNI
jgi:hypothetical protein